MNKLLPLSACSLLTLMAVTPALAESFELGKIEVVSETALPGMADVVVDDKEMREENRETVDEALDRLPGVTVSRNGARNEAMVNVRGFNLRQVPVLVDGIPVYVPYDGYVDLARFTTFDLSEVSVSKSFSSPLLGANTLGGAINLVSRRPVKEIEGEIGAGYNTGDHTNSEGKRTWINIGSNQGIWYGQLSASYLQQDGFSLSDDFDGVENNSGQGSGVRDNSYRKDTKVNIKLGLTPNETDEYAIGYINQDGEKGTPPSTTNSKPRYWQWPYWDKDSIYFLSNTALSESSYIKTRVYRDTFKNLLSSYDDDTYRTQTKGYTFNSIYDDTTYGGSIEYGKTIGRHQLKVAAHYKLDEHKEHDKGEPEGKFQDRTTSYGIEDTIMLTDNLNLVVGGSYDTRKIIEAYKYDSGLSGLEYFDHDKNHAFNPQIGLFAKLDDNNDARVTLSQKSRFATIKDRYSGSFSSRLPNPDLKPERATTMELGWNHKLDDFGRIQSSLFYSHIKDLIQSEALTAAELAAHPDLDSDATQNRNIGEVDAKGLEIAADFWFSNWELGGSYSYLDRNNRSSAARLLDTPRHKLFLYANWKISQPLSVGVTTQYESERYNASDASLQSAGFTVSGLRATYKMLSGLTTRLGVENIFDKYYTYDDGFPEPARTYYANMSYQF
jgi:iron complex outermembrane recepter protein